MTRTPSTSKPSRKALVLRLACIALLWALLCYIMVASQPFSLRVAFIMVASGIVIFVPLYKKYVRKAKADTERRRA